MAVKEEGEPRRELIDVQTGVQAGLHVGNAVGERERQFLHRGGPSLPDVVAADADDVPPREFPRAEGQHVLDQAHAGPRRDDPFLLGDELLQHVGLRRPAQLIAPVPGPLGGRHVHRQQDVGRRVNRHRGGDAVQRQAPEQDFHILQRVDRHALAANLPLRPSVIGVVAHQRGHVKGHRQSGLPLLQQVVKTTVTIFWRPEAGELPHGPQAPPIHGGMDAARERILAGQTQVAGGIERGQIVGSIHARDLQVRQRRESWGAFWLLL